MKSTLHEIIPTFNLNLYYFGILNPKFEPITHIFIKNIKAHLTAR